MITLYVLKVARQTGWQLPESRSERERQMLSSSQQTGRVGWQLPDSRETDA